MTPTCQVARIPRSRQRRYNRNKTGARPTPARSKKELSVADHTPLQLEVADLIVEALELEDIAPADIEPEQPLFDSGLGLDSIDALEIALAIAQRYGIEMKAEDESTRQAFASLATLCESIEDNKSP